jgi:hypothetical protein
MVNFIKNNSKYLTISGAFALLVICYFQQKENAKLRKQTTVVTNTDSLVNVIKTLEYERDSLSMELFPIEIELGRYEVAFQIFSERNPKAAEQYAEIISSETE